MPVRRSDGRFDANNEKTSRSTPLLILMTKRRFSERFRFVCRRAFRVAAFKTFARRFDETPLKPAKSPPLPPFPLATLFYDVGEAEFEFFEIGFRNQIKPIGEAFVFDRRLFLGVRGEEGEFRFVLDRRGQRFAVEFGQR